MTSLKKRDVIDQLFSAEVGALAEELAHLVRHAGR